MSHADGPVMIGEPASTYEHGTPLSSMLSEEHSGLWAWNQNYAVLENQERTLRCAYISKDAYSVVGCIARITPSSHNHQPLVSRKNFNMSSKTTVWPSFKRASTLNDMHKRFDPSDNSDVMDEGEEAGSMLKVPTSKNLMSERKRRKKLNERLFSLRALVPNITKNLQNQVDKIQEDITDLETHKESSAVAGSGDEDPMRSNSVVGCQKKVKLEHRILELEVSQMEEHIYHLRIHCKKTPGVLVQLTRAIEALELEVLNANISSVDDHILNTVVVEVKNGLVMKTEELRNMALAVVPKFGFSLC